LLVLLGTAGGYPTTVTSAAPHQVPEAPEAPAPRPPWTAVASTGVVDESSATIYAFGTTDVGYKTGSTTTASIVIRYNVVNTFDTSGTPFMPGWTTLELGSQAAVGSTVQAVLYRVNPCNGQQVAICRAINNGTGGPKCDICTFPNSPIDFANFLYYVEVTLSRGPTPTGAALPNPKAFTLRIY
jgi:hypothetical protein